MALASFGLTVLLVKPFWETSMEDDWSYALTVRHLLETGTYQGDDWMSANMPFQAYWGALFAKVLGFSHGTLRLSTLVLVLFGLSAFYFLAREHDLSPNRAGLLTLGLWCSPLVVRFSFNFMTDVPYLMWLIIALWLYTRALRLHSYPWMIAGSLAAGAAILTRQFGVVLAAGLGVLWLFDRQRWRKLPFYLSGLAVPALAAVWQVTQGLSAPTWAMQKTARSEILYFQSWSLWADVPWRVTLILQYLALFSLPFVVVGLADLVASWRQRGSTSFSRGLFPSFVGVIVAGTMAWWRWIGGQPCLEVQHILWVLMGGFALSLGVQLYVQLRPNHRSQESKKMARDDAFLVGLAALVSAGVLYGMYFGDHLARFMGSNDIKVSWFMPSLPWNFGGLREMDERILLPLTLLTTAGAVLIARSIARRYWRGPEREPISPARRLLDLVTLFLLIQTLIFCHIGDEYLIVFLPFALIALGRYLGPWLDRLRLGVGAACLVVLLVSALWTRGLLADAAAYWKGGEIARQTFGVEPKDVFGLWTWNCYYGDFHDYLANIGYQQQDTFEDYFDRWRGKQFERAAVHVRPLESDLTPEEGELLAEIPYRDLFFRAKKIGVIKVRD
jgi:hypothetical protein